MRNYNIKYDKDKPDLIKIPREALNAISKVMNYGMTKYGEFTWHKVEADRYLSATLRHLYALQEKTVDGKIIINFNKVDEESKLKHLYHAICNLVFIIAITE